MCFSPARCGRWLVKLHSARGEEALRYGKATVMLGRFYQALARLDPQQRVATPLPFPQASAEDPAGARAVAQSFWREDPAALALLVRLDEGARAGTMDASVAYDLSCRMLLAHRSTLGGPGVANGPGQWLSPLAPDDLGHTLAGVFGPPMQHTVDPQGFTWLSFALDPQRDSLSPALSALGIAAYVGLGVGFSPGKMIAQKMFERAPPAASICYVGPEARSSKPTRWSPTRSTSD